MKVLLINGSPKEKGCTYTALCEVAGALEKNKIETEIFQIGSQPVRGCIGCGGCAENGRCVFTDDAVNGAIEKAEKADALVVGSPVYFASANGALIALLDRMFYAGKSCLPYKPAAAVVSARRAGTTSSIDEINKYFSIRNMPIVSADYWTMVHGNTPEEVRRDLEGMQNMRALGNNMAWLLQCLEAGKKAGIPVPEKEIPVKTSFIR